MEYFTLVKQHSADLISLFQLSKALVSGIQYRAPVVDYPWVMCRNWMVFIEVGKYDASNPFLKMDIGSLQGLNGCLICE